MNQFEFYSVGQGLFYTGKISENSFVYDCGGDIPKNSFKNLIQNYVSSLNNGVIDFITISHLHDDHINGLQDLLNSCSKNNITIRKIILPYYYEYDNVAITDLAIKLINNKNTIDMEDIEILKLVKDLYSSNQYNDYKIQFIQEDTNETLVEDKGPYNYFHYERQTKDWVFKFYNKIIDISKVEMINKKIEDLLTRHYETDIIELIDKKRGKILDELKNIYKTVVGKNLNLSSIILIHYPFDKVVRNLEYYVHKYNKYNSLENQLLNAINNLNYIDFNGTKTTLLTGDVEFDDYLLAKIQEDIKEGKVILQVPHHGSYNNWKKIKPLEKNIFCCVVSFGLGNRYCHPSKNTVKEINESSFIEFIFEINQINYMIYDI